MYPRRQRSVLSGRQRGFRRYRYYADPGDTDQGVLDEMYVSPHLYDDGLLSFHYPLYEATDEELEQFLGKLVSSVGKAASSVAKVAGQAVKTAGKVINTVQKVVPSSILTAGLGFTPIGLAVRAGIGAASAAASGKNVFQGALRTLASDPVSRFYVDTAVSTARGQNILKAVKEAAGGSVSDLRESLRFAAMVAPFVPGIGTGVGAALGAANALASGQPITEAMIAAAKNAVPGGAIAQAGFEMAVNVAKGKNLQTAAMETLRSQLPGGPAAQAAFDAGLALAKGQNIQNAVIAAGGRLLPKSPFTADALDFVKKVANGENVQRAALSSAGNLVMKRIESRVGPIVNQTVARAIPAPLARAAQYRPPNLRSPFSALGRVR